MSPRLPLPRVLDEAVDLASDVALPWMGVAWLAAMPYRLLLAKIGADLVLLGDRASLHGDWLRLLSACAVGAYLLMVAGRSVFARACGLAMQGRRPGPEALRVPAVDLAGHAVVALALLVAALLLGVTVLALPLLAACSWLAAAACRDLRAPGIVAPVAATLRAAPPAGLAAGLVLVFGVAVLVTFANLAFGFHVLLWLGRGLGLVPDPAAWGQAMGAGSPLFLLLVGAGSLVVLEPFWLAAAVVVEARARGRHSGEDLRLRLRRIQAAAEGSPA